MTQSFTVNSDFPLITEVNDVSAEEFLSAGLGDVDDAADAVNEQSDRVDEPNTDFVKAPPRKRNAVVYEKKTASLLNIAFRYAVQHDATVPDAAALIMHGPAISYALGDWAAEDERIARGIDWFTSGSDNPAAATAMALAPLLFQAIRNHEPQLETKSRGIRLPGKDKDGNPRRLRFRFGVKLGRLRPLTNDPRALSDHVFKNPKMRATLKKARVRVAGYDPE